MGKMGKKGSDLATNILATLMLLEIAALAGIAGYLIFTGGISADQVRLAYKVYRNEISDEVLTDAEAWRTHQAEEARKKAAETSGGDAKAKLAVTSTEAEAERLGLLRLFKELQDQRNLLQVQLVDLDRKRTNLEDIQKRIDQKIAEQQQAGGQESFQKMVGIMKAMKPKPLKEILLQMDEATVVDVLKALGDRLAAKVLNEFTTPGEVELKRRYLDLIRVGEPTAATPTASTLGGG